MLRHGRGWVILQAASSLVLLLAVAAQALWLLPAERQLADRLRAERQALEAREAARDDHERLLAAGRERALRDQATLLRMTAEANRRLRPGE